VQERPPAICSPADAAKQNTHSPRRGPRPGWGAANLILLLGIASATIALAQPDGEGIDPKAPAARVGDVEISQGAVQGLVKSVLLAQATPPDSAEIGRLSDSALASLIDLELLHQEALRRRLTVSDAAVDAEIERVRGHFSDADEFSDALRRSNLSRQQLRSDTRKTLLVDALLRSVVWADIEIPEEKVRAFYDEHRAALSEPAKIHLREIVLDTSALAKAEELRSQLVDGADFAELAYNYSTDRTTAARGGDRGFVQSGELATELEKAAAALPIGRVSEVIHGSDGLHIIEVVERRPGRTPPLEDVRASIVAVLDADEREDRTRRYVAELRDKAEIEYFPPFAPPEPRHDGAPTAPPAADTPSAGAS